MTKAEFIKNLRQMADAIEKGTFHFISFGEDFIFANSNYGEFKIHINEHTSMSFVLYNDGKESE